MIGIDTLSSAAVALLFMMATRYAYKRWKQTRDADLWGLIISMALLTYSYCIFTYNAYFELGNALFRYYLRSFHAGLAIAVIWLSVNRLKSEGKRRAERDAQIAGLKAEVEALTKQIKGGRDGS